MQFEFFSTPKIIFGPGKVNSLPDLVIEFGKRAYIVFNGPEYLLNKLLILFRPQEITYDVVKIEHEPTIEFVTGLVDRVRQYSPDLVIAIGGGSAIDTGKAVAALLTNPGDLLDYLEIIGLNKPLKTHPCHLSHYQQPQVLVLRSLEMLSWSHRQIMSKSVYEVNS